MSEPVSVSELAQYLRLPGTSPYPEQSYLSGIIAAARLDLEKFLNGSVIAQQSVQYLDDFPTYDSFELERGPVLSITGITYEDENGITQTFSSSNYDLRVSCLNNYFVSLGLNKDWPETSGRIGNVAVTYQSGYADGSVPEPLKQCVYMQAADLYENRGTQFVGTITNLNQTAKRLAWRYRRNIGV